MRDEVPSCPQFEQFDVFRTAGRDSQYTDFFKIAFGGLTKGVLGLLDLAVAQFASEV